MILAQWWLSEGRAPPTGGVAVGGSKRSERSLPLPGEKGESKSMSTGEPPLLFNALDIYLIEIKLEVSVLLVSCNCNCKMYTKNITNIFSL